SPRASTRCADSSRAANGTRDVAPALRLMRSLFWLLAVFAAAVALVILGRVDAGYVLFVYPPYRVEMSMLLFAVSALAAFVLLYVAGRLLGQALSLPALVRSFRARRRRERAQVAFASAL